MSAPTAVVVGVGAERGLGAALCRRFAADGYHLLVAGRTKFEARIKELIENLPDLAVLIEPLLVVRRASRAVCHPASPLAGARAG